MSSKMTVIREEEDTFEVGSLELSQKDEPIGKAIAHEQDLDMFGGVYDFIGVKPQSEMTIFMSTRHIMQIAEESLMKEGDESDRKVWNFRELLSWKMPDHFLSNSSAKQINKARV